MSRARPRVLMIGPHPPAVGGVANVLDLLCRSSLRERFELIPFSTTKRRTHVFPNRPHWDSAPYMVWHALKLVWTLLAKRPDVVYVKATSDTGFVRDTLLMAISKGLRRPVLCHLHGRPMGSLFTASGGRAARFARWGMSLPDAVIVLSPGLAQAFTEIFPGVRLEVVPNVVEVDRFHPRSEPRAEGPVRILAVGRLSREKGIWDLLEVAAQMRAEGDAVEFVLCGLGETPEEDRAVRARAQELGLDGVVQFRGVVRGDALCAAYREADIFYLPSYAEIFPTVVLEALASGLPVVTTNVPVIPEMFTDPEQGIRVAPGNVHAHVLALRSYVNDVQARTRTGAAGRALAEQEYSVERGAQRVGALLSEFAAPRW